MKFLNNQRLNTAKTKYVGLKPLTKVKEPKLFFEVLTLVLCAFGSLMTAMFTKKYIFGIFTRNKFNFVDFKGTGLKAVIIFLSLLIIRPVIKSLFFPKGGPFSKNTYFGYHIKSASVFIAYDGYMNKLRKIISLLAPYIIVTVVTLTLLKLKGTLNWKISYNTLIFYLYTNALLSCYDIYNSIFIILSPKDSIFYDDGKDIYYINKNNT